MDIILVSSYEREDLSATSIFLDRNTLVLHMSYVPLPIVDPALTG